MSMIDNQGGIKETTLTHQEKTPLDQMAHAAGKKEPAQRINKRAILLALVGCATLLFILSSFLPSRGTKKQDRSQSGVPDKPSVTLNIPEEPQETFIIVDEEPTPSPLPEIPIPSPPLPINAAIPPPPGEYIAPIEPPFSPRFPIDAATSSLTALDRPSNPLETQRALPSIGAETEIDNYLSGSTITPQSQYSVPTIYDTYRQANNQDQKAAYAAQTQPGGISEILTEYSIAPGTIIPAVLVTGINTDLPGYLIAQITSGVYDYISGENLLIPQGSRLIASYSSVISFGQSRVQIAWEKLITPDGLVIDIGGSPAVDIEGYSGAEGQVNNHMLQIMGAVGFSFLTSTVTGISSNLIDQLLRSGALQTSLDELITTYGSLGESLARRWLNVQPTITMKSGSRINVFVEKSLALPPVQKAGAPKKYIRR